MDELRVDSFIAKESDDSFACRARLDEHFASSPFLSEVDDVFLCGWQDERAFTFAVRVHHEADRLFLVRVESYVQLITYLPVVGGSEFDSPLYGLDAQGEESAGGQSCKRAHEAQGANGRTDPPIRPPEGAGPAKWDSSHPGTPDLKLAAASSTTRAYCGIP